MGTITTNRRFLTVATLTFAALMLLWSLAGYWSYPNAIGIRGTGSLACVLAFPLTLIPFLLLRQRRPNRTWVLLVLSLLVLIVGLLIAALLTFGIGELTSQIIIFNHAEFTDEVNYIVWPGLTAGLGAATAILFYSICLTHFLGLAFDLRAHRIVFLGSLAACIIPALFLVASLCMSSA